jgi:hypothetical protein
MDSSNVFKSPSKDISSNPPEAMKPRTCPACGLINPLSAHKCDCGLNFGIQDQANSKLQDFISAGFRKGSFSPAIGEVILVWALATGCLATELIMPMPIVFLNPNGLPQASASSP